MASLPPAPKEVLEAAWGRRGTRRVLPLDPEAASSAAAAGNGLGALPRGCGIDYWQRWMGLEPSMGEEVDGEKEDSEEDEGSATASVTVLGSETDLGEANSPEGGPTRGWRDRAELWRYRKEMRGGDCGGGEKSVKGGGGDGREVPRADEPRESDGARAAEQARRRWRRKGSTTMTQNV
uniref:Uncharacterized protein n=1 Tax=Oryza punctata TaxID=4537 RepID=A0A0E0JNS8_ORYPU